MLVRIVRIFFCLHLVLVMLFFAACSDGDDEVTPTDKGLYINEVYASGEDWIELYNELKTTKDISGYFIADNKDSKYKLPSGITIPAKGFLIILCNDLGTGLNADFKLSSGGETVYLENAGGTLIDEIKCPNLDNGQSYGRFPDGSPFWEISGATTKGATNGDKNAPAINKISRAPLVPALNQSVVVTAALISTNGITSVKLFHRFNGGAFSEVSMTLVSGTSYIGTIPAVATVGNVEYFVEAKGSNGATTFKPAEAPTKTDNYLLNTDPLPLLVINEFMASNTSCCPDNDSGVAEFDDWIEIQNMGATPVNIAGMYVSDNKDNPFGDKISSNNASATTIPAGGFILLWADGETSQGPLHLNFSLNAAGEDVGLFYIDGRTIDTYTFGAQNENISWGRKVNGGATWGALDTPTPGQSNN